MAATWIVKVRDDNGPNSDGQEYVRHYDYEPTEEDYRELEGMGFTVLGMGMTVIRVASRD